MTRGAPAQKIRWDRWARVRAFTLIEVLVAVGITAGIAGFIVFIVSDVSSFWSRTSGGVSAEAQGRFVLDQLALDLQSALYRDDGKSWMAVTLPTTTGNTGLWSTTGATTTALKPANAAGSLQGIATGALTDARFGIAGAWLRFFTTRRGANSSLTTASAPAAVSYQIIRRATSGNEARSSDRRYLLHRTEVLPANTLTAGFDYAGSTTYAPARNTATVGSAGEVRYPTINSVIAENVVDFGVRLYVRDATTATGLRQIFPTSNSNLTFEAKSPSSVPGATDAFPDVIDVMVRVLTDEGSRVVAGYEAQPQRITLAAGRTAQQYWWDLALAHSRVFTRRIVVNAQPL